LIDLIQEANQSGARLKRACKEAGISLRTYKRWYCDGEIKEDQRPMCQRPEPANKLTPKERQDVLTVCNLAEYASLPLEPPAASNSLLQEVFSFLCVRVTSITI